MQSRCFDICLTVKIHTLQNAVCTAPHECFLPAQWRCHTETCGELQPHSLPLGPLENTGGNPSLIKYKTIPSPWLLWSALLWVPTVCDDNEDRKEGNDFVSDWELIYEGPVNWCLLWGDAYRVALLQEVWLSSSRPRLHNIFMTESNFLDEIFMIVTLLT